MRMICALLVMTFSLSGFAEEPNSLSDKEQKEGWKLLFDGKSVKGWSSWKNKKPLEAGKWKVVDGALTLVEKGAGDIYTTQAYENYEMVLEWKTEGNSGILLRVNPKSDGPIYKVAPEMQIERTKGNGSTSAGGLYNLYDVEGEKVIHPDGWNKVRIRMVNGEGTHWFNGKKVYSYKIGSKDWNERVAKSKFKDWKGFGETVKGHIGLQDHGAKVMFRNIKIKEIKDDKKA